MSTDFTMRKKTKKIRVGDIFIGGDSPISIQSMTNTDTRDVQGTINQIKRLEEYGCDIARVAVVDRESAEAISKIKKEIKIPLVADIHFNYQLAIESIKNGVDKVRLNPGNLGDMEKIRVIASLAKEREVPIRIGVNSGSVDKEIISKYNGVTSDGLVESAISYANKLEYFGFDNILYSIKASSVPMTIQAYRKIAESTQYPLHIGITEAGTPSTGRMKAAIAIGTLLSEGIGDTLRVSLTGDHVEEVIAGKEILRALEIRKEGVEFISCPTCGRCQVKLIDIANEVETRLKDINKNIKVAVMGCAVNGPGEAKEADIGIAGGKNEFLLFKKGEVFGKFSENKIVDVLLNEIRKV